MHVVWNHSPATARDVCDRMKGKRERAYTTIMTTMDRLHRKGLLHRSKDGLAWRYEPALTEREFKEALANSLVGRILSTHKETALSAFVDAAAEIDETMLDKLRQLIDLRQRRAK